MKEILNCLLCATFVMGLSQANAQNSANSLPIVKPYTVQAVDFAAKKDYEAQNIDFYIISEDDETGGAGDGDEWYEFDRSKIAVTASSSLPQQGRYTYNPSCLVDGRVDLPWCEGVEGNGIGQSVTFNFSDMFYATLIRIVNGFPYNNATYTNNARAKKLQLAFNGKPVAILELQDVIGFQYFILDSIDIPFNWEEKSFNYTLTILEAYPGAKYKDLLISEVNFGAKARCFTKGTLVSMADGSKKPIENVKKGDAILFFNGGNIASAQVEEVAKVKHNKFVEYTLENGTKTICTPDHPIMCATKGWASASASNTTNAYKGYEKCQNIAVGDMVVTTSGNSKVVSIKEINAPQDSYTIVKAGHATNFIANGIQVGVEIKK